MRQPVDPAAYLRVFELHPEGVQILDELVTRFGRNPYVPGHNGDRDTAYNSGQFAVVQFILGRINKANGAHEDEDVSTPDEPGDAG
ncbi:hypothetical protein [Eleftheria terrae]|uniref:Bbp19 family protein n=1 Tax=Eleftheria terrae TaxID=1597781 RepID=UPI00263BCDD6|nr:hypothetical protein [Eleftheria terrae]WKB53015.1 hypothetical protein N7L95_01010 [Eleftheria terrae]